MPIEQWKLPRDEDHQPAMGGYNAVTDEVYPIGVDERGSARVNNMPKINPILIIPMVEKLDEDTLSAEATIWSYDMKLKTVL